jgi:hypothetical protein
LAPPAAAAGALGVLLVLLEALLLELDSEELEVVLGVEDDEPPLELPSFLVELYRSEYQPPPLRTKLERLTTLLSEPVAPHAVQVSGVGSLTFWRTSIVFWQD